MTAAHTRRLKITRMRLTTDDENAAKAYQDKMTIDLARAVCGDEANKSGVIRGLTVSEVAASMDVAVQPGLGLYYDPTSVAPDSSYVLIEVSSARLLTLDAADPVSPRWDLIEIAPASIDGTPETIDFWDPTIGAFVTANASPLKLAYPTIQFVKGTPSANPKFPSPTPGFIPLAYQYVPGGAASLLAGDTLSCRPILRPIHNLLDPKPLIVPYTPTKRVSGGGLYAAGGGLVTLLYNDIEGFFDSSHTKFSIRQVAEVTLAFGCYDGGGLPVTNIPIFFYAIPAPLETPAGDPNLIAPREFFIANYGKISSGGYKAGQAGCIVVASPNRPSINAQGAPSVGGVASFVGHPNFGNFTSDRTSWFYIGTVMYDSALGQIVAQEVSGRRVSPSRKAGSNITGLLPIGVATPVPIMNEVAGDPVITLPYHAVDIDMRIGHTTGGGFTETKVAFYDKGADGTLTGASRKVAQLAELGSLAITASSTSWRVNPLSGDYIMIDYADTSAGAPSVVIRCESYEDAVLACR